MRALDGAVEALAMVSIYNPPDYDLLKASFNTVWACSYSGTQQLAVIPVKLIQSAVAMVPWPKNSETATSGVQEVPKFFVVEKMGLDVVEFDTESGPHDVAV